MKKLFFFLFSSAFFCSCESTKTDDVKIDSIYNVVYRIGDNYSMAKGKVIGWQKKYVITDSVKEKGEWEKTPIWKLNVPDPARKDTLRDSATHKPLYDSLFKSFRFNFIWYSLTPKELETVKIEVIHI